MDCLLVLGLSPTAKYVAKESFRLGIPCYGIATSKGVSYYSKYFSEVEILSEQDVLQWIDNYLLSQNLSVYVCPTSDEWIEFIHTNASFFTEKCKVDKAYIDESFRLLADKKELQKLAKKLALNYPKSKIGVGGKELPNLKGMDFPYFCKPTNRAGLVDVMKGKKGWVINSLEELKKLLNEPPLKNVELIIQEIIQGPESNIWVLGTVGTDKESVKAPFWVGRKARQFPVNFGSGSLVIQEQNKEIEEIAIQLLKATKYQGFFALETKYCDFRKKMFIIEVNTRPSLWFGATSETKTEFVLHWMKNLGEKNLCFTEKSNEIEPVIWKYWYKDLAARLITKKDKIDSDVKLPEVFSKTYAVWDKNDIKPFFFDLWHGFSKFIQRKFFI